MMGMKMGWGATDQEWRKGPWTPEEDKLLTEYVNLHGEGRWSSVARSAGLRRSGKSCRLRWVNYLRPGLKRGQLTPQEEGIIIELHALWGNKWSTIARYLPGRTDNEIKNYWRTHFRKKEKSTQKQEKRKAQLLKQKQHLQQQQQQNQQEEDNMIIKRGVSSHDADTISSEKISGEDAKQQTVLIHPTVADQCLPVTYQDGALWSDQFVVDEGLWGGLWNLEDPPVHACNQNTSNCNKIATQNQATAFTFGGDQNYNFYNHFNGGYIF